MSKALKEFKNMMVREGQVSKLWKTHSRSSHCASQERMARKWATNESLQKWREKNSSHGNLTFVVINVNEPKERMSTVSDEIWKDVEKQAKDNLGRQV
ncbi:uncharacterized protein BO96DRAFT_469028 [Aspergillus niger CBS 101883]|uniref:uncharacterized protein n=1 Tax=Aspergillus lacticoffeatus (strain CBS 101883) TaxID=1450533 RepID=UPI000D7F098B|nr:uncharacterized protein BO96DRAFT_469028 [Aspergillus niger CBS 101883]PYH52815.1 hypothetical protein BO96DRAFT_469028 [Aspergillus niger CBS 101883]